MKQKVRGHAFRLVGLILGIIGATVSITSIVFAALGLHQARLCKHCEKRGKFPMKYTKEEMLSKVDHTLLKPEATWPQIRTLCDEPLPTTARRSASTPATSNRPSSIWRAACRSAVSLVSPSALWTPKARHLS